MSGAKSGSGLPYARTGSALHLPRWNPFLEKGSVMPDVLKPDLKALVWLAVGLFVAPKVIAVVRSKVG